MNIVTIERFVIVVIGLRIIGGADYPWCCVTLARCR